MLSVRWLYLQLHEMLRFVAYADRGWFASIHLPSESAENRKPGFRELDLAEAQFPRTRHTGY